ncbi:hypothetical protein AVEN_146600-1 [Araneus ventricosus]|uniref:Secreted protein n=1 Tax=Araneus ventricosus TaxID=182803 RepID=A0A4Y2KY93_ARAVE|nr:hypothetical protein AVEN_146600-1 [Araneus ventricosus]
MPSTLTAVFFIVLQLTQNIGCYAECRCGKKSNIWDSVKETVSGASTSELLRNQSIGQYLSVHKDSFSNPPTNRRPRGSGCR